LIDQNSILILFHKIQIMKNLILAVLFISVFASCKKELEPQSTSIVAPAPAPQNNNVPVTPVAAPAPQVVQAPANPNVQVTPQPVSATQKVAKGMNPPHGQPNHRCDIAVGQPLSLPISKTKSVTVPTPTSGSASITPVKMEDSPAAAPAQSAETQVPPQAEKSTTTESK
jgi:hypothetical protein